MRLLSENETIGAALSGRSIARFGDGELRLAVGRGCSSQRANSRLRRELCAMLSEPSPALICLPRIEATPKQRFWAKYDTPEYRALYRLDEYGSAFITRPDNAPEIDRPAYWERLRLLWRGKDVVLVSSGHKDVGQYVQADAESVRHVPGPAVHAYDDVDRIDEVVGSPNCPVLLCLGACATVLAWRLARRGVLAYDLGHVGMFMRRRGVQV